MITKQQLIDSLQAELGDGVNNTADDTVYGYWVDELVQRIWNLWKWPEKYVTADIAVTGGVVADLAVPSHLSSIRKVIRLSDDVPLEFIEREDLAAHGIDLYTAGNPTIWHWADYDRTAESRTIRVHQWPAATETLRLYGWLRPDSSLTAGDVLPLPEEFLPALREGLRSRSHFAEEKMELSEMAEQRMLMRVMEAEDLLARHDPNPRMRRVLDADLGSYLGYRTPRGRRTYPWQIPEA